MKHILIFIFFLVSFCACAQSDADIPARPSPPRLVNDYTGTLTPAQAQALETKLVAYDDSTTSQIAIVIIKTLGGFDIADYGVRLSRKWGIGSGEFDNGILVLVARDDHKMRIEVGYDLEGAIPDITAKSIMDNSMSPQFREGNYYRGLDLATDDIIAAARGEYKAPAGYGKRRSERGGLGIGSIIFLIFLFLLLGGLGGGRGSRGGRNNGGMMSAAGWIIGSMLGSGAQRGGGWSGGGGGGWSGGGGGGFGGFGGGGFGGGGASGSW